MIKKNDFIEIEYTGKIKEDGSVFDTTNADTAKENDLFNPELTYGGMIICVGQGQVLKGLDNQLEGKETGKEYTIEISAEDGFGKKQAKLIQLISTSKFIKQNVKPQPGMQVNIDNHVGVVRTVTGGRTMVDFNHPLASKDLIYKFKVLKIIDDDNLKAEKYIKSMLGPTVETELTDGELKVKTKMKLPDEITNMIEKKISELIQSIKKVVFIGA